MPTHNHIGFILGKRKKTVFEWSENEEEMVDRVERKTQAEKVEEEAAAQAVIDSLLALRPSEYKKVTLEKNLAAAIAELKRLPSKAKGAIRRQQRRLVTLVRHLDLQEIIDQIEQNDDAHEALHRQADLWRNRILSEGNKAIEAFIEAYPQTERQPLRQAWLAAKKSPTKRKLLLKTVRHQIASHVKNRGES